jgi:hypothetical protein
MTGRYQTLNFSLSYTFDFNDSWAALLGKEITGFGLHFLWEKLQLFAHRSGYEGIRAMIVDLN